VLRCHELAAPGSPAEANEVTELLCQRLKKCPICLSTDDVSLTPMSSCGGREAVGIATRCQRCRAPFHRACVAQYAMTSAEEGVVALRCPVPACSAPWSAHMPGWALDETQRARYDRAVHAAERLQAAAADIASGSASGSGAAPELSPRSAACLRRAGVKPCPRCRALIQKQAEGLLTGCDKMTCRCGCMFCFKCGLEAGAAGAARCRCVGAHHSYITHSQVLSNYAGHMSLAGAGDQDLTKRPRGKASQQALVRLRKEMKAIRADPPPFVRIHCDESDMLSWSFVIEGPPDTPYHGGWYWGRMDVSKDYPFWPPLIKMFTPNGRFQTDTWLCRYLVDYHPEGWQPPWTLASVLIALLSLMCGDSFTAGAIHPPTSDRTKSDLARESLSWNMAQPSFVQAFPGLSGSATGSHV